MFKNIKILHLYQTENACGDTDGGTGGPYPPPPPPTHTHTSVLSILMHDIISLADTRQARRHMIMCCLLQYELLFKRVITGFFFRFFFTKNCHIGEILML